MIMIERRDAKRDVEIINNAIKNGDLKEVKNLIENCNVQISRFTYMAAVVHDQLRILEYFLKNAPSESHDSLAVAVKEWNKAMIKTIITFWKNNREICKFNIESAIINAVADVTSEYRSIPPQIKISGIES